MRRIFLDTNILLDVSMKRQPYYPMSASVMLLVDSGKFEGFASSLSMAIHYYIHKKGYGHDLGIEVLKEFNQMLSILDVNKTAIEKALYSDFKDFEDAIQHFCALENSMDCIITRNVKDYEKSEVPVYTPIEFLNKLGV